MRSHEAAELFPLLAGDALNVLVESMRVHGYDPKKPVVRLDGKVLDGRNRLLAAKLAGVVPLFVDAPLDCDPFQESWKHNGARRDIEPDHKAAIYLKILDASNDWQERRREKTQQANAARSKATKEQHASAHGKRLGAGGVSRDTPPKQAAAKGSKVDIAKAAGVSPATIARAEALKKKAPERFEAVARGKAKAHQELGILKRAERMASINAASSPTLSNALGRFPVLYVDPPWRYEHVETESRAIENQYPTMALDEICALPVGEIATRDAVLFIWATSPKLAEAIKVIDAWGFTYRTCMVWVKDKIGMGYYVRQKHELLLIGTRGSPPVPPEKARCSSVVEEPRGAHSVKPPIFYDLIERMYPELKRVELFARKARAGWAAWGNEAP